MSFPFNITNPGFRIGSVLTSQEQALVTELALLSPSDGDIFVYRTAGGAWVLESKPAGGSNPAWGDITGTLSAQTDLQSALDGKAAVSHSHAISNVTGLQTALDGKAAISHSHAITHVTGLQAELDSKSDVGHGHAISDTTGLQTELDGKQDILVVVSSNTTASLNTFYVNVANATYTDPTPEEGRGYTVFVRNGTATIGGQGYASPTYVSRVFHSGAWQSYIFLLTIPGGAQYLQTPIDRDLIPDFDSQHDIGSTAARFAEGHFDVIRSQSFRSNDSEFFINDTDNNELFNFARETNPVNYITSFASATGNALRIQANGTDTNVGISLVPKGTGNVKLGNFEFNADQAIGAGQDNYVLTYNNSTGLISLEESTGDSGGGTFTWQGAWQTATAYTANDVVEHNGSGYVCILGHTSGSTTEPGVGASWTTNWDLFVEGESTQIVIPVLVEAGGTDLSTGDALNGNFVRIPAKANGMNLTGVAATVFTAGTTGTTDIQIRNVTDSVDMLSTKVTIDSGETDSSTAATPAVIDTTNDDVATGDVLVVDVDAVSTTAPQGLLVELTFELP